MASVWTELLIDCEDPRGLAEFWRAVLGFAHIEEDQDGDVLISDVERTPDVRSSGAFPPALYFQRVPDGPKKTKNRLHIDLSPIDRSREAEVERVLALGATLADIGQGEDVRWTVLADPEGNEFCVLRGHAGP